MTGQSANRDLRLGIVGTGAMAVEMARAADPMPGISVTAVLSRSSDRAAGFCKTHVESAEGRGDMAAFFAAVDAVYIATPAAQHGQYISAAVAAQKPVLCEKPLTGSASETQELLAHARAQGVLVMEAIWTLALPAYRALKAKAQVSERSILQFDFSWPLQAQEGSHYFDPETGGVLLDRSVYGCAVALDLLGGVTRQSAFVTRNAAGLDTSAELRLEHETGARSLITLAFDRVGPNALHVSTERGLLSLGPSSLVAETLAQTPAPEDTPHQDDPGRQGMKDKLKALPLLRKLRTRLPARQRFFSYGASCYAPILQEFAATVARGNPQSAIVPHSLSEEISRLTEAARSQT